MGLSLICQQVHLGAVQPARHAQTCYHLRSNCHCAASKAGADVLPLTCMCLLFRMRDERGLTALHVAAKHNQRDVLQWLSVNVTDLDSLTPTGYTPIHLAAMHGNTECIKVLSAMGAQLDYRNGEGETPLHLSAVRYV